MVAWTWSTQVVRAGIESQVGHNWFPLTIAMSSLYECFVGSLLMAARVSAYSWQLTSRVGKSRSLPRSLVYKTLAPRLLLLYGVSLTCCLSSSNNHPSGIQFSSYGASCSSRMTKSRIWSRSSRGRLRSEVLSDFDDMVNFEGEFDESGAW
jgi:hypothetical protein